MSHAVRLYLHIKQLGESTPVLSDRSERQTLVENESQFVLFSQLNESRQWTHFPRVQVEGFGY